MTEKSPEALLPFHVSGTLSGPEAAEVEAALARDPDLRAEAEALRAIRTAMKDDPVESPGEFGLARLMRSVDRETKAAQKDPTRFWQYAAGLVAASLLGLSLMSFLGGEPDFQLAGGGASDGGPGLVVGFEPDATAGRIQTLLLDQGLIVASGPSALGLWYLAPLDGTDLAIAAEAVLASGLAETVEQVDAPP